jgi:hypothetical protein
MSHNNYADVFGMGFHPSSPYSKANQYITSVEGVENPLRKDVEETEAHLEP